MAGEHYTFRGREFLGNHLPFLRASTSNAPLLEYCSDCSLPHQKPSNSSVDTVHSGKEFATQNKKSIFMQQKERNDVSKYHTLTDKPSLDTVTVDNQCQLTSVPITQIYRSIVEEFRVTAGMGMHISPQFNVSKAQQYLSPGFEQQPFYDSINTLKSHFSKNSYQVLDISNGHCEAKTFRASEIMHSILSHVQETPNGNSCNLDEAGDVHIKLHSLKASDVRRLVSPHASSSPYIQCFRQCIIMCLPPIRSVIMHNKTLFIFVESDIYGRETSWFFDQELERDESLDWSISSILEQCIMVRLEEPLAKPPELLIIEIIYSQLCKLARMKLLQIRDKSRKLLHSICSQSTSTERLLRVTGLREKLENLADFVQGVERMLDGVLDSDDAVRTMCAFWCSSHKMKIEKACELWRFSLEPYEHDISSIFKQVVRESDDLDNMLRIMELHLASIRNFLLKSELGMNVVGVGLAFIAAVSGIFGMNLKSGVEHQQGMFWLITAGLCSFLMLCVFSVFFFFKRVKL